jgi:hypothetical protein
MRRPSAVRSLRGDPGLCAPHVALELYELHAKSVDIFLLNCHHATSLTVSLAFCGMVRGLKRPLEDPAVEEARVTQRNRAWAKLGSPSDPSLRPPRAPAAPPFSETPPMTPARSREVYGSFWGHVAPPTDATRPSPAPAAKAFVPDRIRTEAETREVYGRFWRTQLGPPANESSDDSPTDEPVAEESPPRTTVTVTFHTATAPARWADGAASFRDTLAAYGKNNYTAYEVSDEFMQVIASSPKSAKEIARQISGRTTQWKKACGVASVTIVKRYVERDAGQPVASEQASSDQHCSSIQQDSSAPSGSGDAGLPTWVPTDAWRRAADHHFRRPQWYNEAGHMFIESNEELASDIRSGNIQQTPMLLFPTGMPDSSIKKVPAYQGHPDFGKNMNKLRMLVKDPSTYTCSKVIAHTTGQYKTEESLVDETVERMFRNREYDDGRSEDETHADYEGLTGEALRIAMDTSRAAKWRAELKQKARCMIKADRAAVAKNLAASKSREDANRARLTQVGTCQLYVIELDPNELAEIARRIAPIASSFKLVVGGDAAERVASLAGVRGLICPSLASAALPRALYRRIHWYAGRQPSDGKAWLNTVGVALERSSDEDNRLIRGQYVRAREVRVCKRSLQ